METGKAYGFFNCNAPQEEIETYFPMIRRDARTPSQLELSLIEGMDNLLGDEQIKAEAEGAKSQGIRYVLEATYPGATNETTAKELGDILNLLQATSLYEPKEKFCGLVLYKHDGEYLSLE